MIFAPKEHAEAIVEKLRQGKYTKDAAIIGEVTEEMPGRVVMTTEIGAETLLAGTERRTSSENLLILRK